LAQEIQRKVAQIPGIVDSYIYQEPDAPALRLNVDRLRAAQLGLTQQSVAGNVLVSLSSNTQVAPSFYLDLQNGVQYNVQVQTPSTRSTRWTRYWPRRSPRPIRRRDRRRRSCYPTLPPPAGIPLRRSSRTSTR